MSITPQNNKRTEKATGNARKVLVCRCCHRPAAAASPPTAWCLLRLAVTRVTDCEARHGALGGRRRRYEPPERGANCERHTARTPCFTAADKCCNAQIRPCIRAGRRFGDGRHRSRMLRASSGTAPSPRILRLRPTHRFRKQLYSRQAEQDCLLLLRQHRPPRPRAERASSAPCSRLSAR